MTETKAVHTPGPWMPGHFVDENSGCKCRCILSERYMGAIAEIRIDNGLPISEGGNDCPPLEEAKANGRLIAAAPDLFEIVTRMVKEADDLAQSLGLDRIHEAEESLLADARAALAKSLGA